MTSDGSFAPTGYYTGIDGGGTYTRVLVQDERGVALYSAQGEGSNVYKLGVDSAVRNISRLIAQISRQLPDYHSRAVSCCLGLAGVTEGAPSENLHQQLSRLDMGGNVIVHNDAYLASYGIALGQPAIALISGTGSVAFGIDDRGKVVTGGGFGYLYADEGSGFAIGSAGVRAAIKYAENRGDKTTILSALFTETGIKDIAELPDCLTEAQSVARIAPMVYEQAEKGDQVALDIITDAARELSMLAESARYKGSFDAGRPLRVAMFGGCLQTMPLLRKQVVESILVHGMIECEAQLSPEQAAAEIARTS